LIENEEAAATFLLDLCAIEASVEARAGDGGLEYLIVLSDGYTRVELASSSNNGRSTAAVFAAQRVATAALDYAAGLALLHPPETPDAGGKRG
jgi:hypothetical protein